MNPTTDTIPRHEALPASSRRIQETSLALVAGAVLSEMNRNFLIALEKIAFPFPSEDVPHDAKSRNSARKKLATFESQQALLVIWKESQLVCDESLAEAEMVRTFVEKPMSKHSLANECCKRAGIKDPAKIHSVESDTNRIFAAAETFGLVRRNKKIGNLVPIEGTEKLDELMRHFNGANALILYELHNDAESSPENSGDCI